LPENSTASFMPIRLLLVLAGTAALSLLHVSPMQAQEFFPLKDVRPGLKGVGRTVFSGGRVEEFQVDFLGVLRNMGPKQGIVLARLSGGPLAQTGVMQGMSGSPVYINGKLLGAVALGFPFSKEPIAGIQPIDQMLAAGAGPLPAPQMRPVSSAGLASLWSSYHGMQRRHAVSFPSQEPVSTPFGSLGQLQIPLSFTGFTGPTLRALAGQFRELGFEPFTGLAGGQTIPSPSAATLASNAATVTPGSMISVGLLSGDMNITADGTVTYVNGKKVYAFGHRFLDIGSTDIPFAHSEVVALIPNLNSSFKLSTPQAWVGSILSDRNSAISGEIGRPSHTIPLSVSVHSDATGTHDYHFQVVNDRFLTPFITQSALFSVLDATERTLGRGTLQLVGRAEWEGSLPPLEIRDTFVSDSALVQQVSADAVVPVAFVLGGGFTSANLKSLSFRLEASESKHQLRLAQAWTSSHDVRPGETIEVTALLEGENGARMTKAIRYRIPPGTTVGPLNFTLSDANTLNFPDFAGLTQASSQSAEELIRAINSFRDNDSVYVRVWRQQPAFNVSTSTSFGELTDPPPSVSLVLSDPSDSATTSAAATMTRGSSIVELPIPTPGFVVSGAKTLQVDVKE
jgi:hypothetical protein